MARQYDVIQAVPDALWRAHAPLKAVNSDQEIMEEGSSFSLSLKGKVANVGRDDAAYPGVCINKDNKVGSIRSVTDVCSSVFPKGNDDLSGRVGKRGRMQDTNLEREPGSRNHDDEVPGAMPNNSQVSVSEIEFTATRHCIRSGACLEYVVVLI